LLPVPTGYAVQIAKGLHPLWSAAAAAANAYAATRLYERGARQVLAEAEILSVEAVAGRDVPKDRFGCCEPANAIRWIVHAQGTFYNEHGGPGGIRAFGTDGWFLFDDGATGDLTGFSFSELSPDVEGQLGGDAGSGCTWLADQSGTKWQIEWPSGWRSDIGSEGTAELLTSDGQQAAASGSTVGVLGQKGSDQGPCSDETPFAATAVVFYSFGPLN